MGQEPPKYFSDRYTLLAMLDKGGMGEIYQARDERLGIDVTIKMLKQELIRELSDEVITRFTNEARITAGLKHPNIAYINDRGHENGRYFLVMEFLEGESLRGILSQGNRLTPLYLNKIIRQTCSALEFAHKKRVIHRDISPGNIFITEDGEVKVLDFGIARFFWDDEEHLFSAQGFVGTPAYASPELMTCRQVDHRTDIYSAAKVFHEIITGKPPVLGQSTEFLMRGWQGSSTGGDTKQKASSFDSRWNLATIFWKALHPDPDNRYRSAGKLSADLMEDLHRYGVPTDFHFDVQDADWNEPPKEIQQRLTGEVQDRVLAMPVIQPPPKPPLPASHPSEMQQPRPVKEPRRQGFTLLIFLAFIGLSSSAVWGYYHWRDSFRDNKVAMNAVPAGDICVYVMNSRGETDLESSFFLRSELEKLGLQVSHSSWLEEFFGNEHNYNLVWNTTSRVTEPALGNVQYLFLGKLDSDGKFIQQVNSSGNLVRKVKGFLTYRVLSIHTGEVVASDNIVGEGVAFTDEAAAEYMMEDLIKSLPYHLEKISRLPLKDPNDKGEK